MKKILLGCAAASALLIGVAVIGLNKLNTPSVQKTHIQAVAKKTPAATVQKEKPQTPIVQEEKTPDTNLKLYSISEEQILEAAETYLYYKNLDDLLRPDVRSDGDDFIITFDNPNDPEMPKYELRMIRIADFNEKKQYQISSESWIKWAEFVREYFNTPQISADTYEETISWVPDLALTTNTSVKASDISIADKDIKLNINSVFSDSLVGLNADKIDIASASNFENVDLKTDLFQLSAPKIIQNTHIIGSEITGNKVQQILTAKSSEFSLEIPTIQLHMPLLGQYPITASIKMTQSLETTPEFKADISNIKSQINIKNLPQNIQMHIALDGVNRAELLNFVNLEAAYNQEEDIKSDSAKETERLLIELANKMVQNTVGTIKEITVNFPDGSLSLTGTLRSANEDIVMKGTLSVTNFDTLSPRPQPANQEACEAALKNISLDATHLPPECAVKQSGMLDYLRPFLDMAKRTTNTAGETVDTFDIDYNSAGYLSVNSEVILSPDNKTQPEEETK